VAIAAGGTAGHVVPALAVAAALRDRGVEVRFVGGERAEVELVPAAGYPIDTLHVTGLDRRNPLLAVRALGLAATATVRARALLRRLGTDVVLGGGGYVAAPVGLAARSLGIPLALSEADSHLGVANRLLAPFARRIFLALPIARRTGPRYVVTGRPVPPGTGTVDGRGARERLGIEPDGPCLLVFGGSLGARSLNFAAIEAFGADAPCAVLHNSGVRDYPALRARLDELGSPPHYHLHAYAQPFADSLAAADLAAARAGGSVFELAAAGLPSILVPYPEAAADHQTKNARWMASAGAALVVPDAEITAERLASEVRALLAAPERMTAMSAAARRLARPDAAERVADELLALAR
jgi:UDP-N-acetylglucosamine--N-acetylmuramyl-(pentapeptide) pyrophosphoryl-undecaprenol N-acetylglucosamine transferase